MSTVISKSVSRAFALLELFRREQRPLTATAIETALALPQASALVLARELAALGYLAYDSRTRTYFPSERLANLAGWLGELDLPVRRLAGLADEAARATSETTSVCGRNGHFLQIEHFVAGTQPGSILMHVGRGGPLPCSGAGRAVLATLDDTEVRAIVATVRRREPRHAFSPEEVMKDVQSARRRHHLVSFDLMIPGVAAVAFPLPLEAAGGHFALVVGGPTPRIEATHEKIVRTCRPIIARHFGAFEPASGGRAAAGGSRRPGVAAGPGVPAPLRVVAGARK
jgi:DNA-binding IclR family transcriptional regulator